MKISYLKTVPLQNVRSNLQPRDYLNISSFRGPLSLSLPKEKVFQGASDTTRERRRNISGIYNSIPLLVLGYQGIGYWTHQPRHFDLFLSQSSILFVKKKREFSSSDLFFEKFYLPSRMQIYFRKTCLNFAEILYFSFIFEKKIHPCDSIHSLNL